jgi:2-oxoglutarate dehydrogenase E2 component (dihydrolipoamide succinyltransferase)
MKEKLDVPQIGESISEAQVSKWLVENGAYVEKDQDVVEIDSDKTTLTVSAPVSGQISFLVSEGEQVLISQTIAEINTEASPPQNKQKSTDENKLTEETQHTNKQGVETNNNDTKQQFVLTPLASKKMKEDNVDVNEFLKHYAKHRIGVKDVEAYIHDAKEMSNQPAIENSETRKPMSPLRKKVAQRLVAVKNETAMLTTFNEIDMSRLMSLRSDYGKSFQEKHFVKLGYMSFFAKASAIALKQFPSVNAMMDETDIVYFSQCHIGIAVSTDKGLMVPVIRNVEEMSLAKVEKSIQEIANKARAFKLQPSDFEGGTFTITNGGVFGSLLSTPIINPPQTAILGMHSIQERPMAIKGQVVVRPMMYVALSYDHRVIDGKESVGFLMEVKRLLENPEHLLHEGKDIYGRLLEI